MPAPLSPDLRRRIVAATKTRSQATVAVQFSVARSTVQRFVYLDRATPGDIAAKAHNGGPSRSVAPAGEALVAGWLTEHPSLTQAEIAARLTDAGLPVSRQTAGRTLARMGYTRKKSR